MNSFHPAESTTYYYYDLCRTNNEFALPNSILTETVHAVVVRETTRLLGYMVFVKKNPHPFHPQGLPGLPSAPHVIRIKFPMSVKLFDHVYSPFDYLAVPIIAYSPYSTVDYTFSFVTSFPWFLPEYNIIQV